MFYQCRNCAAVLLDADLNIWHCPHCGAEELEIVDDRARELVAKQSRGQRHIPLPSAQLTPLPEYDLLD